MTRKIIAIGAAFALVFAVAFVATGGQNAVACKKGAKASNASAKAASAGGCCKSAAKNASASACNKSAKNASASACNKSAKNASASACNKSAKTAGATCSKSAAAKTAALKALVDEIPYRKDKTLMLTGSMECGKCTYDKTASCAPLFKTTDGKVFPLAESNVVHEMHELHAASYQVKSRVKKTDGIKYLDVKSFKAL